MKTLAERITYLMQKHSIRNIDLAKACGISRSSVSDWTNGKTKNLEGMNLLNAAKVFGVRQQWLAEGIGPEIASSNSIGENQGDYSVGFITMTAKGKLSAQKKDEGFSSESAKVDIFNADQYVMIIDDQSFAPRLRRGDRVVIDSKRTAVQGDDILVTSKRGDISVYCLHEMHEQSFDVMDRDSANGLRTIYLDGLKPIEVIAAIFPKSSMPDDGLTKNTLDDRLKKMYGISDNKPTW